MSKVDRRIIRTRELLRDALLALILERGYDAVTVQDIAERANLGRATFYLHYRDKEELLTRSLETLYDGLIERMGPVHPLPGSTTPALLAFQHAAEHSALYRVLLSGQGSGILYRRVREYIAQTIGERLPPLPAAAVELPPGLLPNYIAGALLSLIGWWLENDMPETPETMAQVFRRLLFLGIADLTGVERGLLARLRTD